MSFVPAPPTAVVGAIGPTAPAAGGGVLELSRVGSVHWGAGCSSQLATLLAGLQVSRVAVITSRSLAQSRLLGQLDAATGQLVEAVFAVPAHVPRSRVTEIATELSHGARAVQAVVSFGGGSAIDAGKAVLYDLGKHVLHVAVPTNLSGAEVSAGFGVTEHGPAGGFKQSFQDPAVSPTIVFYDPDLTVSTAPELWAASGIKALDHAIEGLLNSAALPALSAIALNGIRELSAVLRPSVTDPGLRARAQLAAWQCYFAPANFRYGLSHRIGHILGGTFGVGHSATSAVTLAPVIRATAPSRPEAAAAIADALGAVAGTSPVSAAARAADRLAQVVTELGLPGRLSQLGLSDRADLGTIERLLRVHYPETIASFETSGPDALRAWLTELW